MVCNRPWLEGLFCQKYRYRWELSTFLVQFSREFLLFNYDVNISSAGACVVTRLWAEQSVFRIPVEAKDSSLLQSVYIFSGSHQIPYSVGSGILSRG
jgi:hypothetical protein